MGLFLTAGSGVLYLLEENGICGNEFVLNKYERSRESGS